MTYFPKTLLRQDIQNILASDAASDRGDGVGNLPPMAIAAKLNVQNDAGQIGKMGMNEIKYILIPTLDCWAEVGLLGFVDHGPRFPREYLSREAAMLAIQQGAANVTLLPLAEGFTVPQPPCEIRDAPPSPAGGDDDGTLLRP